MSEQRIINGKDAAAFWFNRHNIIIKNGKEAAANDFWDKIRMEDRIINGKDQTLYRLVASGTVTAANTQLSLVDGTAFAYFSGVDLSAYQTGKHLLAVYNSSTGLLIGVGYCSATPPAGETLASTGGPLNDGELLTNPTFDANTTGWTPTNCTLASVAGGQSNNCLEITMVSGTSQVARNTVSVVVGGLYKASSYVKSGTSGNEEYRFYAYDGTTTLLIKTGTSSGSWVQGVGYFCSGATSALGEISLRKISATAGTMLFDEPSLKAVTDPASTGVRIEATPGGAQTWTTTGPGGLLNANILYKIWSIGN